MNNPSPTEPAPPRPLSLRWSAMTHRGRFRANNEDTYLALACDGHEVHYLGKTGEAANAGTDLVFAVSDGMGGAKSGEYASRIAVDHITKLMPGAFRLNALGLASGFSDILIELFDHIHRDLLHLGQAYEECAGMGTTLSLCWFTPAWLYFGHIGDSRIYYLPRDGGLKQLTHDHTHVGWLLRQGRIREVEARAHPGRNALQQSLGASNQIIDPQIGALDYQPGDRFLICSDGLIDGLWDRGIERIIQESGSQPASPPAVQLVEEAVRASGRDNVTAIVIEIAEAGSAAGTPAAPPA